MFLHLRMGQESVPQRCRGDSFWLWLFPSLWTKDWDSAMQRWAKLVSIWLSLSTTKVHKLKPGSPYLSKTLRAVKSLNNVMTHLFLPGLEMWDPLVMPPGSSPCCHPGVLGAQHRPAHGWAETAKSLPSTGDSHLAQGEEISVKNTLEIPGLFIKATFLSCHCGVVENCCCLLCLWTETWGR